MDSSLIKKEVNDPITDQRKYLLFKSIYTEKDKTVVYYVPSDRMIAESIIYVMVATMKQMKVDIQRKIGKGNIDDSIPIYVPTVLVVNELASNMLLSEHFKTIVFGIHYKSNKKINEVKLILLAKTLANKTSNDFITEKDSFKEYDESNDGIHILSKLSGCDYETRYKIWLNKIKNLLLNSDELLSSKSVSVL